jgi:hypothetical protein
MYRIMDVGILIKMFKEKRNYLSSPQNWADQWEKLDIYLKSKSDMGLFETLRNRIYAQCWTKESYSWALWKMNSPYGYGVRIKTKTDTSSQLSTLFTAEVVWRGRNYWSQFSILRSGMREKCLTLALTTVNPLHKAIEAIMISSIPTGCPAENK